MSDIVAVKRCAIYTRKSTDEGLDQSFNSLDAQREACSAYILSQRHEGWTVVPETYEDGGYSGGTMTRPGLAALLLAIKAGKVDVIVVYKVDRLTRNLAHFAKMVEVLDEAKASFVSVTQAFNTTSSMGRLTLNVLLSFAQFEREITGERIRDKFAASKAKGMFMGGNPPLGYRCHDRGLHIVEQEAELVRLIFARYAALKSVRRVKDMLDEDGHRTRISRSATGASRGGMLFGVGTLYYILRNRVYLGKIPHKGIWYPGKHLAIIDDRLWSDVAHTLAVNRSARCGKTPSKVDSSLASLLVDAENRQMTPCTAKKGSKLYRYYVTQPRLVGTRGPKAVRMSGPDLEDAIVRCLIQLLSDGAALARIVDGRINAADLDKLIRTCADAVKLLLDQRSAARTISVWLQRATVGDDTLTLAVRLTDEISYTLCSNIGKVRRGYDVKLVIADPAYSSGRDEALVALIAEAHRVQRLALANPEICLKAVAALAGVWIVRFRKLLRISYLAPDIVKAIIDGYQPPNLTVGKLNSIKRMPLSWTKQSSLFSPSTIV